MLDSEVYKLNALPGIYVPNAIYFIKKGVTDFDMYVANSAGTGIRKVATADNVLTTDNTKEVENKTIDFSKNNLVGVEPSIPKSLGYLRWTAQGWAFVNTDFQPAASVNGLVKSNGYTRSAAVGGTDYLVPNDDLKKPSAGDLSNCTANGVNGVSPNVVVQNKQISNYTLAISDNNKHIFHPSSDVTARTITIPANTVTPFPIGATITVVNHSGAGALTIAINTDTLRLIKTGTTGSRSLAPNGIATLLKVDQTEWIIYGINLS